MTDQEQTERGASTVDNERLVDEFLGLPAALSVLQNELNKCELRPEIREPLAQQISSIRRGVIDLQRTLVRERKADIWVADAWVSRADLERVTAERDKALAEVESSMDAWFTHERICSDGNHVAAHIKDVLAERWSLMAERDAMREVVEIVRKRTGGVRGEVRDALARLDATRKATADAAGEARE